LLMAQWPRLPPPPTPQPNMAEPIETVKPARKSRSP
jgi:hypothetical protein